MADILHDLPINAPVARAYDAVSTTNGLDAWWTLQSNGMSRLDQEYELGFGPGYDWRATVTKLSPPRESELEVTRADADWTGTRVGFRMQPCEGGTWLQFSHSGWKSPNEHFRISCNCWALYLRILRRLLEYGESALYDKRLAA
jgi:hypothetical protein